VICPNGGAYQGGDKLAYEEIQRIDVFINPSGDLDVLTRKLLPASKQRGKQIGIGIPQIRM